MSDHADLLDELRYAATVLDRDDNTNEAYWVRKSIETLERLTIEVERLTAELRKACSQHNLLRCKGCGDYVDDLADEDYGYCWGCQDEIDEGGEIDPEYKQEDDPR